MRLPSPGPLLSMMPLVVNILRLKSGSRYFVVHDRRPSKMATHRLPKFESGAMKTHFYYV